MFPQSLLKSGRATRTKVAIPAKALLFGEYGVMLGYPAAVVTLPCHCFTLEVEMIRGLTRAEKPGVTVESPWFPGGALSFPLDFLQKIKAHVLPEIPESEPGFVRCGKALANAEFDKNTRFFVGIFLPWIGYLTDIRVIVKVTHSFPPALGFGSSSALLGGIHRTLWSWFYDAQDPMISETFWRKLRTSLHLVQGGGSGYDLAVQCASVKSSPSELAFDLWKYQWAERSSNVPSLTRYTEWEPQTRCFGAFLATHVYSDTQSAIKAFQSLHDLEKFAHSHGKLSEEFLDTPTVDKLPSLMERSRAIAREQGILPSPHENVPLARLSEVLDSLNIPYKSMGAGGGDCMWALTARESLKEALHPISGAALSDSMVFDFSQQK